MAKQTAKKKKIEPKEEYPEMLYEMKPTEGIAWALIVHRLENGRIVSSVKIHEDIWPIIQSKHFNLIYPK